MAVQNTKTNITKNFQGFWKRINTSSKNRYSRTTTFIKKYPLGSFFIVLGLLLIVLIIGKVLNQIPTEKPKEKAAKAVSVYSLSKSPVATFQAKVEKSGVVKLYAQSSGVVQTISVKEGDKIGRGQQLIGLSTNYQGGNAQSVQREIAQTQYQNVLDTFGLQNDLIARQRDVATASAENAQQTRDISKKSADDTGSLININQTQLDQINQQLTVLRATDPTNPQIAQLEGSANQIQASLLQLRGTQRTTEYQSANDKPPALLTNLQKDITLKQLDVQQKGQELNKEVSHLQVNLASVSEGLMFPASPFTGTVERILVRKGQLVSPGQELATIVGSDEETSVVLLVPQAIAEVINTEEASQLIINGKIVKVKPSHIATEATDGQLYAVRYDIPKDEQKYLTDGEYVSIQLPIGATQTALIDPIIPIDAVYQTQDKAYVLIAKNNKAETKIITPGEVFGNYVSVKNGLRSGDQVILDRNVIAEDRIELK